MFLVAGAVLMILLGLARGAGGILLLLQGGAVDPQIVAEPSVLSMLAIVLVLIGIVEVVAGFGTWRSRRPYWVLGIVATVLFVMDGAVNGYIIYGRPGDRGTLVNAIVAILIISMLLFGRKALVENPKSLGR